MQKWSSDKIQRWNSNRLGNCKITNHIYNFRPVEKCYKFSKMRPRINQFLTTSSIWTKGSNISANRGITATITITNIINNNSKTITLSKRRWCNNTTAAPKWCRCITLSSSTSNKNLTTYTRPQTKTTNNKHNITNKINRNMVKITLLIKNDLFICYIFKYTTWIYTLIFGTFLICFWKILDLLIGFRGRSAALDYLFIW